MRELTNSSQLQSIPEVELLLPDPGKRADDTLERMILKTGHVAPVLVWKGTNKIISGSRRKKICDKHSIPYPIEEIECEDEQEAIDMAIREQVSRRNMTPAQMAILYSDSGIQEKIEAIQLDAGISPAKVANAKRIGKKLSRIKQIVGKERAEEAAKVIPLSLISKISLMTDAQIAWIMSAEPEDLLELKDKSVDDISILATKMSESEKPLREIIEASGVQMKVNPKIRNASMRARNLVSQLERLSRDEDLAILGDRMKKVCDAFYDALEMLDNCVVVECSKCGGLGCGDCDNVGWCCRGK